MEKLVEQIKAIISKLYAATDVDVVLSEVPANIEGDYSTNVAMRLSRVAGKNPREVAGEIIAELEKDLPAYKYTIAGPGFINIEISAKSLYDELAAAWSDNYGYNQSGAGKVAIVEYPSTNMAKPYSVGHLRPGTQGWASKQILEANGWKVITDNHLGDSGTPFGIWAIGFLRSGKKVEDVTIYDLGEIYIEMKRLLKEEEAAGKHDMADEVQDWLLRFEAKDPEAVELAARFKEISLDHTHEVMNRMGISTEYELGESFFVERGKEIVKKYVDLGVFKKNEDGSVICELDDMGIDVPMLLQKSNGAALYATTDLACMDYRASEWKPDLCAYCVGAEQKFYFEQLFALGKKLGLPQRNLHVWFGTIDQVSPEGKREKMSSRKGVVLMEELLDDAEKRVRENFAQSDISDEDIKKIAVGAIKFSDFIADRKTGILYDPEKIFALTGFSGPFCQYADVRLRRIMEKGAELESVEYADYDWREEKEVLRILLEFPALVESVSENLEAHRIAAYCFKLAQELNRYYEKTPILQAEAVERSARLELVAKADLVLSRALGLLGVEVPERM